MTERKENIYPYKLFKARRDQQELEKKKIIDLVQFLHKKHKGGDVI